MIRFEKSLEFGSALNIGKLAKRDILGNIIEEGDKMEELKVESVENKRADIVTFEANPLLNSQVYVRFSADKWWISKDNMFGPVSSQLLSGMLERAFQEFNKFIPE